MARLSYDTDLTDEQWQILEPLIPTAKPGGRPRILDMREVFNAIFYLLANGIKWRVMPNIAPTPCFASRKAYDRYYRSIAFSLIQDFQASS